MAYIIAGTIFFLWLISFVGSRVEDIKMSKVLEASQIQLKIARENATESQTTIRLTTTERMWIRKIANHYGISMSEYWRRLNQQAITDFIIDGDIMALEEE